MGELEVCLDQDYHDASWQTRLVTPRRRRRSAPSSPAPGSRWATTTSRWSRPSTSSGRSPTEASDRRDDRRHGDDGGPDRGDHDVVRRATLGRCDRRRAVSKVRVGVIGTGAMGTSHVRTLSRWVSQAQVVTAYDADVARVEAGLPARSEPAPPTAPESADRCRRRRRRPDRRARPAARGPGAVVHRCRQARAVREAVGHVGGRLAARSSTPRWQLGRRLVQVGFMRRYDPAYVALRATVASGDLGAVRVVALRAPQRRRRTRPRRRRASSRTR